MHLLFNFLKIIEKFSLFGVIKTTTSELSELLDLSQQAVSRLLDRWEEQEYIDRISSTHPVQFEFREKSFHLLKHTYYLLNKYFSDFQMTGKITRGIGEGRYYVTLPGYSQRFKDVLNINPFPGTLNLQVDKSKVRAMKLFFEPVEIKGFSTGARSFGSLNCYKCIINQKTEGWVIFAERTTHKDNIIEVISEEKIESLEGKVKISFVKKC